MEVHHHPNAPKKSSVSGGEKHFKHYLFEFLMLFLAVFAGFLAENQREHFIEHKREKQYMRSLIKDLEQDLRNMEISLAERTRTLLIADSMTALLLDSVYQNQTRDLYYYARSFSTRQKAFYMTDGTLMQLKNSGGLRLIRDQELVDSLQAYDNLYHEFARDQELENDQLANYRDMMIRLFDVRIFNTMVKGYPEIIMPEGNPALFNTDRSMINEFLMRVHLVKRNKLANNRRIGELCGKAERLIEQINAVYGLK